LQLKTILALLGMVAMLALTTGVGVAGANGSAPITVQGLLSRVHNSLECITQWRTLYEANGTTTFKNVVDCVLYAAEGGQFGTPPPPPQAGPVITSVVTSLGANDGCFIVITGTGFTGTTGVTDSALPAQPPSFTVNADGTQIDAVPQDVGTGFSVGDTFTVTTPAGTASGANTIPCAVFGNV
jgi:hypothetical protein